MAAPQPMMMAQPQYVLGGSVPPMQGFNQQPTHVERRGSEFVGVIPTGKTPPPMAPQMAQMPVPMPQTILVGSAAPLPLAMAGGSAPPVAYVTGGSVPPMAAPQPMIMGAQVQGSGMLSHQQCQTLGLPFGARWKESSGYEQEVYGEAGPSYSGTQV
mmetsp:Transcript_24523/g.38600  ORF Transcript_24523/g.38600 Transcript_24523/m.38600 type:complete len:157 (-) Transcript_24523:43-513(-)